MALISVIIPTFNRAPELVKALSSLVDQTFKDFEVIIVDDGSIDNTDSVVSRFSKALDIKFIKNEIPSGGAGKPRNIAASVADGEWLAFLDSDDWWYPEKLKAINSFFSDYDIIGHNLDAYNCDGTFSKVLRGRTLNAPIMRDLLLGHNGLLTSATAVRRTIFLQTGGFSLEKFAEDYELWLKVASITNRFKHIDLVLGGYLINEGSLSKNYYYAAKSLRKIYRKYLKHLHSKGDRRIAVAVLLYVMARQYHKGRFFSEAARCYFISVSAVRGKIRLKAFLGLMLSVLKVAV